MKVRSSTDIKIITLIVASGLPVLLATPAFAATGDVAQVESFIRTIIKIVATLAGLIATGFFVLGGLGYITSSGNPERLDRAKSTLSWSAIGLVIVIAAFVLVDIIAKAATESFGS